MEQQLVAFLNHLTLWHWFGLGILLFVIEVLGTAGFLFWAGIAAIFTGLLLWIFPSITWPYQFLIFAVITLVVVILWWCYLKSKPLTQQTDKPLLNRRSEQYIGRIFTLEEAIVNGRGTVRVDDSRWQLQCSEDYPAGTKVKIIAVDGVCLIGEQVNY